MTSAAVYNEHMNNTPTSIGQIPFYIGIHVLHETTVNYHPFAEFVYIIEGEGEETIGAQSNRIAPGTVSFIPPHQMHKMKSDSDKPIKKYCCMFDMTVLSPSVYDQNWPGWIYKLGADYPTHAVFDGEEAAAMQAIFEQMLREFGQSQRTGRSVMIQCKLIEALTLFRRAVCDRAERIAEQETGHRTLFWPILHHVHLYYMDKLTLESIAKQFHVSESYIGRMFRERTGKSFLEYVHQLRIDGAVSMLMGTEMKITEIAYAAGFESFRTFSRVFRELKGVVPSEFRKQTADPSQEQGNCTYDEPRDISAQQGEEDRP